MPFDYAAAMRASGVTPDMYENQAQFMEDMRARAKADQGMRQQMITDRARNWYRGYMGKEPPRMPEPPQAPQQIFAPAQNPNIMVAEDGIRALLRDMGMMG